MVRDGRIVGRPEDREEILEADDLGVIVDLGGLGVIAEIVVSWIARAAASIANTSPDDTGETPELGVGTPESSKGEGHRLDMFRWISVDERRPRYGDSARIALTYHVAIYTRDHTVLLGVTGCVAW